MKNLWLEDAVRELVDLALIGGATPPTVTSITRAFGFLWRLGDDVDKPLISNETDGGVRVAWSRGYRYVTVIFSGEGMIEIDSGIERDFPVRSVNHELNGLIEWLMMAGPRENPQMAMTTDPAKEGNRDT